MSLRKEANLNLASKRKEAQDSIAVMDLKALREELEQNDGLRYKEVIFERAKSNSNLRELKEVISQDLIDVLNSKDGYVVKQHDILSLFNKMTIAGNHIKFNKKADKIWPGDIITIENGKVFRLHNGKKTEVGVVTKGFKSKFTKTKDNETVVPAAVPAKADENKSDGGNDGPDNPGFGNGEGNPTGASVEGETTPPPRPELSPDDLEYLHKSGFRLDQQRNLVGPDGRIVATAIEIEARLAEILNAKPQFELLGMVYKIWADKAHKVANSIIGKRWRDDDDIIRASANKAHAALQKLDIKEFFDAVTVAENEEEIISNMDEIKTIIENVTAENKSESFIRIMGLMREGAIDNGNSELVKDEIADNLLFSEQFSDINKILNNPELITLISNNNKEGLKKLGITDDDLIKDLVEKYQNVSIEAEKNREQINEINKERRANNEEEINFEEFKKNQIFGAINTLAKHSLIRAKINTMKNRGDENKSLVGMYADISGLAEEKGFFGDTFDIADDNIDMALEVGFNLALMAATMGTGVIAAGAISAGSSALRASRLGAWAINSASKVRGGATTLRAAGWATERSAQGFMFYEAHNLATNTLMGEEGSDYFANWDNGHEIAKSIAFFGVLGGLGKVAQYASKTKAFEAFITKMPKAFTNKLLVGAGAITAEAGALTATSYAIDNYYFDEHIDWSWEEFAQALVMVGMLRGGAVLHTKWKISKGPKGEMLALPEGISTKSPTKGKPNSTSKGEVFEVTPNGEAKVSRYNPKRGEGEVIDADFSVIEGGKSRTTKKTKDIVRESKEIESKTETIKQSTEATPSRIKETVTEIKNITNSIESQISKKLIRLREVARDLKQAKRFGNDTRIIRQEIAELRREIAELRNSLYSQETTLTSMLERIKKNPNYKSFLEQKWDGEFTSTQKVVKQKVKTTESKIKKVETEVKEAEKAAPKSEVKTEETSTQKPETNTKIESETTGKPKESKTETKPETKSENESRSTQRTEAEGKTEATETKAESKPETRSETKSRTQKEKQKTARELKKEKETIDDLFNKSRDFEIKIRQEIRKLKTGEEFSFGKIKIEKLQESNHYKINGNNRVLSLKEVMEIVRKTNKSKVKSYISKSTEDLLGFLDGTKSISFTRKGIKYKFNQGEIIIKTPSGKTTILKAGEKGYDNIVRKFGEDTLLKNYKRLIDLSPKEKTKFEEFLKNRQEGIKQTFDYLTAKERVFLIRWPANLIKGIGKDIITPIRISYKGGKFVYNIAKNGFEGNGKIFKLPKQAIENIKIEMGKNGYEGIWKGIKATGRGTVEAGKLGLKGGGKVGKTALKYAGGTAILSTGEVLLQSAQGEKLKWNPTNIALNAVEFAFLGIIWSAALEYYQLDEPLSNTVGGTISGNEKES